MAPIEAQHPYQQWRGRRVVGGEDRYIGTLEEVYLYEDGQPTRWAVVDTGVGANSRSFIPLPGARLEGDAVRIAPSRARVLEAASQVDPDGELTAAEEDRLERIYSLGADDGELIRSEERLRIATAVRSAGRVGYAR